MYLDIASPNIDVGHPPLISLLPQSLSPFRQLRCLELLTRHGKTSCQVRGTRQGTGSTCMKGTVWRSSTFTEASTLTESWLSFTGD